MNVATSCSANFVRSQHTLTVVKALAPATDGGKFVMDANGTTGPEAGDGASSSATVEFGTVATFGELAGTDTDLANYATTYVCDNGGPVRRHNHRQPDHAQLATSSVRSPIHAGPRP